MFHRYSRSMPRLLLLALPIAVYMAFYVIPVLSVGQLSIDNGPLGQRFPNYSETYVAGQEPDDVLAAALLNDLVHMPARERAEAARMLNQEISGFRSLLIETGKSAGQITPTLEGLTDFDPRWKDNNYWQVIASNVQSWTPKYFQRAIGIATIEGAPSDDIYMRIMWRTLVLGAQVTLLTLIIGYPLAYAIANGGKRVRSIILVAVLLSFWTSILVRTTAWVVLLQTNGLLNKAMLFLGVISEPLQLIFNRFGTIVAMTHVLLPFAILPIMNVMSQIPISQDDASRSLGAGPIETFLRVYFPQTLRGVAVGGGTVFILSLGFYVTPALVGGPGDQMLSYYIADFVQNQLNWGMAATLSVLLMLCVILMISFAGLCKLLFADRRTS